MREAGAFWIKDICQGAIVEEELPPVKNGWCEIETLFSAVSPGTEWLIFSGLVPEDLYDAMRCPYMDGDFPAPVKYGYSLVGRVAAGSNGMSGKVVHVLHPHQDRAVVRMEDTFIVPADVPAERATLASNLETVVNAVWDSQVTLGERALVVGFGIVGSLVARVLSSIPGVEVTIVDTNPQKVDLAEKMGFSSSNVSESANDFDLAFHASGAGEGLQTAIDAVGFEGRVVDLSWYGIRPVSLQLGGSFHSRRKRIISSQVSHLPPQMKPRWDPLRRRKLVFSLLKNQQYDRHITDAVPFTGLPRFFDGLGESRIDGLSYLVEYK